MNAPSEHPELLPWWVSGKLDPAESRSIQSHVDSCDRCREEANRLSSMRRALLSRPEAAQPHVSTEQLVIFQGGTTPLDTIERDSIQRHIEICASCREDLETLQAAGVAASGNHESFRNGLGQRKWAWAAGIFLALAGGAVLLLQPQPTQPLVLAPALRDAAGAPGLTGPGPWNVIVELPLDAPDGAYAGTIAREDGSNVQNASLESTALRGQLALTIPTLPTAGRYRLELAPRGVAANRSYTYFFRVDSGTP